MFCPACRDEFRPGFTRCAACGVDLVETLDRAELPSREPAVHHEPAAVVHLVDYCGFVSLDEARQARQRLRSEDIRGEIVIRDDARGAQAGPPGEEYWLRVDRTRLQDVHAMLGFDEASGQSADAGFQCDACGADVGADESTCPSCGASFEDA